MGAALLLALFTGLPAHVPAQQGSPQHLKQGQPAPDFTRSDLHGERVRLASFHGKVVLLNFWATWCAPCLTEMPVFSDWQRKEGSRGLQVIGVAMDDDAPPVQQAVQHLHLQYPVLMGDAGLATDYGGVLGLPVTLLIGRDGKVLKRYDGASDLPAMQKDLASALAGH